MALSPTRCPDTCCPTTSGPQFVAAQAPPSPLVHHHIPVSDSAAAPAGTTVRRPRVANRKGRKGQQQPSTPPMHGLPPPAGDVLLENFASMPTATLTPRASTPAAPVVGSTPAASITRVPENGVTPAAPLWRQASTLEDAASECGTDAAVATANGDEVADVEALEGGIQRAEAEKEAAPLPDIDPVDHTDIVCTAAPAPPPARAHTFDMAADTKTAQGLQAEAGVAAWCDAVTEQLRGQDKHIAPSAATPSVELFDHACDAAAADAAFSGTPAAIAAGAKQHPSCVGKEGEDHVNVDDEDAVSEAATAAAAPACRVVEGAGWRNDPYAARVLPDDFDAEGSNTVHEYPANGAFPNYNMPIPAVPHGFMPPEMLAMMATAYAPQPSAAAAKVVEDEDDDWWAPRAEPQRRQDSSDSAEDRIIAAAPETAPTQHVSFAAAVRGSSPAPQKQSAPAAKKEAEVEAVQEEIAAEKGAVGVMCCYYKLGSCRMGAQCWYAHAGAATTPCHYGTSCKRGHRHLVRQHPEHEAVPLPPAEASIVVTPAPTPVAAPAPVAHAPPPLPPALASSLSQATQGDRPVLRPRLVAVESRPLDITPETFHPAPAARTAEPSAAPAVDAFFFDEEPQAAAPAPTTAHDDEMGFGDGPSDEMAYGAGPYGSSLAANSPLVQTEMPCLHCGASCGAVHVQEFPVYIKGVRTMAVRGHCAVCNSTFSL